MVRWNIRIRCLVCVLMRGFPSFILRSRLEDLFNSQQLDCWNRVAQTHSWGCESRSGRYVLSSASLLLFLAQALIGVHVWATTESLEVLGVFGILLLISLLISAAEVLFRSQDGFTVISLSRISQPIWNTQEYIGEQASVWRRFRLNQHWHKDI